MASSKKCPWSREEDMQLVNYISKHGIWNWSQMPKHAGLSRTGKSCRLRWMNYLDPQVKRGNYSQEEDEIIISMRHNGAGWSSIAESLPGRSDNEIKNRWHSHLSKRLASDMVQSMEPYREQIVLSDLKAIMNNDILMIPEASQVEVACEDYPLPPHILNIGALSSNMAPPTCADPHIRFWRDPYSLENIYDTDEYATYAFLYSERQSFTIGSESHSIPIINCYEILVNPINYTRNVEKGNYKKFGSAYGISVITYTDIEKA